MQRAVILRFSKVLGERLAELQSSAFFSQLDERVALASTNASARSAKASASAASADDDDVGDSSAPAQPIAFWSLDHEKDLVNELPAEASSPADLQFSLWSSTLTTGSWSDALLRLQRLIVFRGDLRPLFVALQVCQTLSNQPVADRAEWSDADGALRWDLLRPLLSAPSDDSTKTSLPALIQSCNPRTAFNNNRSNRKWFAAVDALQKEAKELSGQCLLSPPASISSHFRTMFQRTKTCPS